MNRFVKSLIVFLPLVFTTACFSQNESTLAQGVPFFERFQETCKNLQNIELSWRVTNRAIDQQILKSELNSPEKKAFFEGKVQEHLWAAGGKYRIEKFASYSQGSTFYLLDEEKRFFVGNLSADRVVTSVSVFSANNPDVKKKQIGILKYLMYCGYKFPRSVDELADPDYFSKPYFVSEEFLPQQDSVTRVNNNVFTLKSKGKGRIQLETKDDGHIQNIQFFDEMDRLTESADLKDYMRLKDDFFLPRTIQVTFYVSEISHTFSLNPIYIKEFNLESAKVDNDVNSDELQLGILRPGTNVADNTGPELIQYIVTIDNDEFAKKVNSVSQVLKKPNDSRRFYDWTILALFGVLVLVSVVFMLRRRSLFS